MEIYDLLQVIDNLLECSDFKDVSYNGLQVQNQDAYYEDAEVNVICTAADASLRAIEQAAALKADLLLVHHGLYWRGADPRAVGVMSERLRAAFANNLSIAAYHLPLDASMKLGNNAMLCQLLKGTDIDYIVPGDKSSIGMTCNLEKNWTLPELCRFLASELKTEVQVLGLREDEKKLIDEVEIWRVAVCSGSGSSILEHEPWPDFDVLITGDVSEQIYQISRECGVPVIAAGHHATEQAGIKALGEHLARKFGLTHHHLEFELEKETVWFR